MQLVKKNDKIREYIKKHKNKLVYVDNTKLSNHYQYLDYSDDYSMAVSTTATLDPLVSLALSQTRFCLNMQGDYEVVNKTYWPTYILETQRVSPDCSQVESRVKYDARYSPMHSKKTVGLESVYKQNNILPYLDKVSTNKKHDFFEEGDP